MPTTFQTTPDRRSAQSIFSWPESQFKGGDGYDGPAEESKPFKVYVIHEEKKSGDNQ